MLSVQRKARQASRVCTSAEWEQLKNGPSLWYIEELNVGHLICSPGPSFINCPYHAHNEFLRGAQYGHPEGCYSCFIGPFEDAWHPCSRRNIYLLPQWCRALLPRVKPCLYEASRSWLAGLNFRATMTSQYGASDPSDWPWHIEARHFYLTLALPLRSFDVWRECKINVSACERYTINCGTPSIQNAQIDPTEVARCTLLLSCLIVFVAWVSDFFLNTCIEL